jgi:hypothetical protein
MEPPIDPMDASTQDSPIDLAPFNAPAVRVRADRLAKPQELHAHTNPINPPLTSSHPQLLLIALSMQPYTTQRWRKLECNRKQIPLRYLNLPPPPPPPDALATQYLVPSASPSPNDALIREIMAAINPVLMTLSLKFLKQALKNSKQILVKLLI